jgi:hypothetical protein
LPGMWKDRSNKTCDFAGPSRAMSCEGPCDLMWLKTSLWLTCYHGDKTEKKCLKSWGYFRGKHWPSSKKTRNSAEVRNIICQSCDPLCDKHQFNCDCLDVRHSW